MNKITNCLQLISSEPHKLPPCDYCDGKLLYSVYKLLIKSARRKNPPPGATDLNITTIKTKSYKIEYANCLKCNANYKISNISYYSKFRKHYNCYLESIPDINKDLNYTVSVIIKTYHKSYNNIIWKCTKEDHNFHERKTIRFTNYFLFLAKLHNAVKKLLSKQELNLEK